MKNLRRYLSDFMLGTLGLVIMNAVMQFVVIKYFNTTLSESELDLFLFFTGMIGFLGGSLGAGPNYSRMAASTRRKTENGDYNCFLLMVAVIILIVIVVCAPLKQITGIGSIVLLYFMVTLGVFRYYGDVEYRLNVNYKRFFCYYVLIAMGYVVGMLLFPLTHSWSLVLLFGEGAAVLFVAVTGSIFKGNLWKRSEDFKINFRESLSLSVAYMFSDFPTYADRLLLPTFGQIGDTWLYYVATLIGKIITLLTTPLNGVLIGHLSKFRGEFKRKHFALVVGIVTGLFFAVLFGTVVCSHIFIYVMYREDYNTVKSLLILANAIQVLYFFSNTMMVVILRFADEKYQMYIGSIYVLLFAAIVLPLLVKHGLQGFAWGMFIINLAKYLGIVAVGFYSIEGPKKGAKSK